MDYTRSSLSKKQMKELRGIADEMGNTNTTANKPDLINFILGVQKEASPETLEPVQEEIATISDEPKKKGKKGKKTPKAQIDSIEHEYVEKITYPEPVFDIPEDTVPEQVQPVLPIPEPVVVVVIPQPVPISEPALVIVPDKYQPLIDLAKIHHPKIDWGGFYSELKKNGYFGLGADVCFAWANTQ